LREALCGFSFDIKYVNKKVYTINNQPGNIIPPNYQKVIPNIGLTREGHTGNLIIQFQTKFPDSLSLDKIEELNKILS
jgi:DnaJ-class molecular chaperone